MPVIKVRSKSKIKKADIIYSDKQIRDEIEKIKQAVVEESQLEKDIPEDNFIPLGEEIEEDTEKTGDKAVFSQEYVLSDSTEPMDISMDKVVDMGLPEEEVKEKIQAAYDEGFADGQDTTAASFKQQIQQHERWLRSMDSVIEELRSRYSKEVVNFENSLADLAIMVAEHILEREISSDSQIVVEQTRKAIRSLDEDIIFKIRIHPDNLEILKKVKSSLVPDSSRISDVVLAPDKSVDKGGCVLETSAGSVDAKLSTQLDKLRRSLKEVSKQPPSVKESETDTEESTKETRPENENGDSNA